MNERIKELLKQSGGFTYGEDGEELTPMLVGKQIENFAELIVQEFTNECRKLWYEENNKSTEGLDKREIGIHVGSKGGILRCLNSLEKLR